MKVGLISDIHANLPALETVLDDMPTVDRIVCAGDVIGYNPWPAECVERVREVAAMTVRGNHDRTVETPEKYRANRMAEAGLEHAKESLSDDQRAWLDSLPRAETFTGDRTSSFVHAPRGRARGRLRLPRVPTLDRHMGDYDGIVLGHTHVQGKAIGCRRSRSQPGERRSAARRRPGCGYAVLDTQTDEVDLHRVAYDIDRVSEAVADAGLPERTAARLYKGRVRDEKRNTPATDRVTARRPSRTGRSVPRSRSTGRRRQRTSASRRVGGSRPRPRRAPR